MTPVRLLLLSFATVVTLLFGSILVARLRDGQAPGGNAMLSIAALTADDQALSGGKGADDASGGTATGVGRSDVAAAQDDGSPRTVDRSKEREAFISPLLQKLSEFWDGTGEWGEDYRDATDSMMRDADFSLARIKEENRRALNALNRQVRIRDCRTPNVVFVLLDDVGIGDLGCYCQQHIQTPMFDAICEEGTQFCEFYAGSADSVTSWGTLLSGRLSARGVSCNGDWVTVREEDFTLAEMMYRGGYATGLFGKWCAGPQEIAGDPNSQGFQQFFGYRDQESAEDYYPEFLWRNHEQVPLPGNLDDQCGQYAPDLIVEEAKRFVHDSYRRPFFLMLSLPMTVTGSGNEVPDFGPYEDTEWPLVDKTRAALLTRVDSYVREILAALYQHRCLSNTLIIVTSDNGPSDRAGVDLEFFGSTTGLRGKKGELYEGGIRVPLIIRWAGRRRLEATCCQSWSMWDLLPTLADLTCIRKRPCDIDGVSLFECPPECCPPPCGCGHCATHYWELRTGGYWQAVRLQQWKAVRPEVDAPWQLFDLASDPAETTDVAELHPDVIDAVNRYVDSLGILPPP